MNPIRDPFDMVGLVAAEKSLRFDIGHASHTTW
jgi:hypothetical protein